MYCYKPPKKKSDTKKVIITMTLLLATLVGADIGREPLHNYIDRIHQDGTIYINNSEETANYDPCGLTSVVCEGEKSEEPTKYTKKDAIDEIIKATFGKEWKIAKAIMMAESQGEYWRVGDKHIVATDPTTGEEIGDSIGLFQIRTGEAREGHKYWNRCKANGMTCGEFKQKLVDPEYNIKYAHSIYARGGWNAWSTYHNNRYKEFL